jgi:hypothetical protein
MTDHDDTQPSEEDILAQLDEAQLVRMMQSSHKIGLAASTIWLTMVERGIPPMYASALTSQLCATLFGGKP